MLTRRGFAVLGGGALTWLGARIVGSPELHVVAVGLLVLVSLALALTRWRRHDVHVTRRLGSRRAFAGSKLRVDLEVHNRGRARTSMMLIEDRLPVELGRAARAVLLGLGLRERQTVSYEITCARRGRYRIGPVSIAMRDPFGLAERRTALEDEHQLMVFPEVEELRSIPVALSAGGSGEAAASQLLRRGEEFYTMRPYQTGDDLRRIHWPSTARSGELMIRQDERGRRASVTVFLDSRPSAFGGSSRGFERAVSACASAGALYLRDGVGVNLASADSPPRGAGLDDLLEQLALIEPAKVGGLLQALAGLRASAAASASLVVVTGRLSPQETSILTGATAGFGHRLAILVQSQDGASSQAHGTRVGLGRAGWECIVLPGDRRLRDVWTLRGRSQPVRAAALS